MRAIWRKWQFSTYIRDNNLANGISNTVTVTINHQPTIACCWFAVDFLAMGTAVAHSPLRQLDFLVISADCSCQWRIQEFVQGAIHLLLHLVEWKWLLHSQCATQWRARSTAAGIFALALSDFWRWRFSWEQLMSKCGHSFILTPLIYKKSEITMQRGWLKWCKKMITNSKLVVVEVSSSFNRWRHYFPKLI